MYLREQVEQIAALTDPTILQSRCTELYNKISQDNPQLYQVMKFMIVEAWRDQVADMIYLQSFDFSQLSSDLPTEMYDVATELLEQQEQLATVSRITIRTADTSFKVRPANYLSPAPDQ